ncbi:MAG TPA: stage V sporulation protein AD [Bacillota bacterium]|nr:stage V sporulation protein AD [Bacillota bacterium]
MTTKRVGGSTIVYSTPPVIVSAATVAGPKESEGQMAQWFDELVPDDMFGERTPEKAERRFMEDAIKIALGSARVLPEQVNMIFAGDLLNQIITSSFTAEGFGIPFVGLYGACSTMAQSLTMASAMVDGGYADLALAVTSSHYQTAERQFRYPIELNIMRKSTSQYTVTGAGAALVGRSGGKVKVTEATIGKVIDMGIKDPNQMGPAMAPAAADTIFAHLADTGRDPGYYDIILTGDLGRVGAEILCRLMAEKGVPLGDNYSDAGILMFEGVRGTGVGGSGCACSALITYGFILKRMCQNEISRALVVATGALMSPISWQQGESIPCIANAVVLET